MRPSETAGTYCDRYGFDARWRADRLSLLHLDAGQRHLAVQLQEVVIGPAAETVIDDFYAVLLAEPETRALLNTVDIAHLRGAQLEYLRGFGLGFDQPAYFESRFRVGIVHAWVGIPLGVYLCAYRLLTQLIHDHIRARVDDIDRRRALEDFTLKIAALDMSLACEIYHVAQVERLEMSLDSLRSEHVRLRHAAETDELTGMATRASALAAMTHALADAVRGGEPLCVVMADLDHFKAVNDYHGHLVGDRVLRDVAARMRSALRDFDVVGRYGGEEFLVVLKATDLETAARIAERVRRRVAESPVSVGELTLEVTISQGLTAARAGDSVEALIMRADRALYAAKMTGRNRVTLDRDDAAGR